MEEIYHITIKPHWDVVNDVHMTTQDIIETRNISKSLGDAISMTATELLENAIKYGASIGDFTNIEFQMGLDSDNIFQIEVSNGIVSEMDLQSLEASIKHINECPDTAQLYQKRLLDLLNNPDCGRARLGLLRIVYEGKFKLCYSLKNNVVTVTAKRKLG